ncbi:MAG: hypothetical protein IPJ46_11035 [Anaerolineales bacterium]|nr:hypothetical protein [Anaerolineales bacterium]
MPQLVNEWGRRLNIKLSPHDLRRFFATPARIVQVAGSWENPKPSKNTPATSNSAT